jgi:hypothetical protein
MGGRVTQSFSAAARRFGAPLRAMLFLILLLDQPLFAANPPTSSLAQKRRDWWFQAPGGAYGLVEVTQIDPRTEPSRRTSTTSILIGPWRWTFNATAPQVLTIIGVPTFVGLFTYGWIRTRQANR